MPVQSDTNGIGAHTPIENPGVGSPFHGGGGGGGGGGAGAPTHELDGASYTVPGPHSAAPLTPGVATVTNNSGANEAAAATARCLIFIAGLLLLLPTART
jgi:hypothetical protein